MAVTLALRAERPFLYSAFHLVCEGPRAFNLSSSEYELMTSEQLDPAGLGFLHGRFIGKTSADRGSFRQVVIRFLFVKQN